MAQLRIALAQTNPTVGDLAGQRRQARRMDPARRRARRAPRRLHRDVPDRLSGRGPGAAQVVRGRVASRPLEEVGAPARATRASASCPSSSATSTGPDLAPRVGQPKGAPLDAAAAAPRGPRWSTRTAKHHLPNYGVFDEYRYFVRGDRLPVFRLHGVDVAIAVCEDLWQDGGPVSVVGPRPAPGCSSCRTPRRTRRRRTTSGWSCARGGPARPAARSPTSTRSAGRTSWSSTATRSSSTPRASCSRGPRSSPRTCWSPTSSCPPVSAPSPATFPVDAGDGTTITVERLDAVAATPSRRTRRSPRASPSRSTTSAEVYAALVLAVRDYVAKNGFRSVILGLSGGIDSALIATIAADAIGPDRVHVVLMPSRYSSDHSLADAEELVRRQGITARVVPIADIVDRLREGDRAVRPRRREPPGAGARHDPHGPVQRARPPGADHRQQERAGDRLLHPLRRLRRRLRAHQGRAEDHGVGAVPLAQRADRDPTFLLAAEPPIPENSIAKEPSAELRPDQRDTDSLPPYEVLDRLLDDYVEKDMGSRRADRRRPRP